MPIPKRHETNPSDRWNLSSLFADAAAWEDGLRVLESRIPAVEAFRGRLAEGPDTLRSCLDLLNELGLLDERLGYYSFLGMSEDAGDSARQSLQARYTQTAVRLQTAASFLQPELLALDQATLDAYRAAPALAEFRIALDKMLRFKPHTLSAAEERLLAMQEEANQSVSNAFRALTDVDMAFGAVDTPEGPVELSQSSYGALLMHPDRSVRATSFRQFHAQFDAHKNTLSSLYAGSVNLDCFQARARGYAGSLEAALFPDKVEPAVYHNLVAAVRGHLPALHRYYGLRARVLGLPRLELWDTKVSLVADVQTRHGYDEAVDLVIAALAPLGGEYCRVLGEGLRGGWVDRYENQGKRSGAFSAGSYAGWPYILLNYKETVLRDVFTLAHEAGHSMHSWYSARHNPFQHYKYSIFEAEVASTFNEQLLFRHLMAQNPPARMKAYLINKQIDDILATVIRQTMFAEFELRAHRDAEQGRGLTLEGFRSAYRELLGDYFGPTVAIDPLADLEGLRIPHFYRAFYVYKYATGLSAALALSQGVLAGKAGALDRYLGFLRSGGSSYPLANLAAAGVDLATPAPIEAALGQFAALVDELDGLLAQA